MIGKQSQLDNDEDNQSRIKLITNKRRFLEEKSAQIEAEIKSCFNELVKVLRSREKQLLRQAEAIHRQQLSLVETSLDFLPSSIVVLNDRSELEEQICQFGNIETYGLNGITVKDAEPYKVVDYQDANKDHVSFDKAITCQKIKDQDLSLPRCKDFISDYRTLRISRCSPLLIIKRKLGLTHVSLDGLHAFGKAYSRTIQSLEMSYKNTESCRLDILTHEEIENNLQELDKEMSSQDDSELIRYSKQRKKNYEHPIQVQQWLQQILAETEIEPAIHEIGQFSEISKVKLCNKL
ncbi:hypothetical protein EAG_02056 [Camponotus floridanus]|uniref:Uncharacterized protein n=1 Tax=Camponotus floridanus TaxID=104421 RepID=E2A0C6_CAMFO|nr:hypothetical protein EAG_02056 [Camponotus floridanus]